MKTLLLHDTADGGSTALALEAAGHTVVRCHPTGDRTLRCAGLQGHCPMDGTVDVAVVVHEAPGTTIDPGEAGGICALRDGVPLVVAGNGAPSPFRHLATAIAAGPTDVAGACERAVAVRERHLGQLVDGEVTVNGGRVRAVLRAGASPADAVRAHRLLVDAVPSASVVDVVLAED